MEADQRIDSKSSIEKSYFPVDEDDQALIFADQSEKGEPRFQEVYLHGPHRLDSSREGKRIIPIDDARRSSVKIGDKESLIGLRLNLFASEPCQNIDPIRASLSLYKAPLDVRVTQSY
jgi:hypothetical protein